MDASLGDLKKGHEDTLMAQNKIMNSCQGDIESLKKNNYEK